MRKTQATKSVSREQSMHMCARRAVPQLVRRIHIMIRLRGVWNDSEDCGSGLLRTRPLACVRDCEPQYSAMCTTCI